MIYEITSQNTARSFFNKDININLKLSQELQCHSALHRDSTARLSAVKSPVVTDKQYCYDQSKPQTAKGEGDVKQASG